MWIKFIPEGDDQRRRRLAVADRRRRREADPDVQRRARKRAMLRAWRAGSLKCLLREA